MKLIAKPTLKSISKLSLFISIPLSIICLSANAATTTTTTTTTAPTSTTSIAKPASANAITAPTTAAIATSTIAAPKKAEAPSVKYSISYEAGYSMQAQTQSNGSRSQSMSHSFTPGLSYGEYGSKISLGYEQDLLDSASNGWADPTISLSKKAWTLGDYFKLAPSATLTLPMTDSSKNDVGLMYNIGGALGLSLNTKALGLDNWSFGYQLAANKNFTNYDTKASSGTPNNSHKLRNRVSFGYNITDSLSFFNMFDFNSSYSVNGVLTNSFFSLQSFGYGINDNISVSLAHSNGGAYLKSGTYENNLKFFDAENSSYSFAVEVSL